MFDRVLLDAGIMFSFCPTQTRIHHSLGLYLYDPSWLPCPRLLGGRNGQVLFLGQIFDATHYLRWRFRHTQNYK